MQIAFRSLRVSHHSRRRSVTRVKVLADFWRRTRESQCGYDRRIGRDPTLHGYCNRMILAGGASHTPVRRIEKLRFLVRNRIGPQRQITVLWHCGSQDFWNTKQMNAKCLGRKDELNCSCVCVGISSSRIISPRGRPTSGRKSCLDNFESRTAPVRNRRKQHHNNNSRKQVGIEIHGMRRSRVAQLTRPDPQIAQFPSRVVECR
jgi:hypothetical protein